MLYILMKDSLNFFRNNIYFISAIIIPIAAPIDTAVNFIEYLQIDKELSLSENLVSILVRLLTYPIYAIGVIFYISGVISAKKYSVKELWWLGFRYWLTYTFLITLVSILVIGGLFILIFPGVLFAIRYSFSEIYLLLEKSKPLDAMKKSWNETRDYFWLLLKGYLLIALAINIPDYLLNQLIGEGNLFQLILSCILGIIHSILNVFYMAFTFRVYEFSKNNNTLATN